jgi:hypothetical protein
MAKKNKLRQIKTPIMELSWAYLTTPEEWKGKSTGKLSIQGKASKEDAEALITLFEQEFEAAKKASEKFKSFKPQRGTAPKLGFRELANGDIVFKFKTLAVFTNKQGETQKRVVPVFDAAGKPYTGPIGNGSLGRVAVSLNPYAESSSNYGVALYLDAIQVLKVIEFGGSSDASAFGFEADEDFISNDAEDFDASAFGGPVEETEGDF